MGLFSRSKTIGTLTIQFADDNTASVTTTNDGEWATDIKLFCWYYAKVVTNLRYCGDSAKQLVAAFHETAIEVLRTGTIKGPLLPDNLRIVAALPQPPAKTCIGTLNVSGDGTTVMITVFSPGVEHYHAPISVFVLIHHILSLLDEHQQRVLWLAVAGMHKYYEENGWTHIQSINEAPWAGLAFARHIVQANSAPAAT